MLFARFYDWGLDVSKLCDVVEGFFVGGKVDDFVGYACFIECFSGCFALHACWL